MKEFSIPDENFLEENMSRIFDCNIWLDIDESVTLIPAGQRTEAKKYIPGAGVYSTMLSYMKSPEAANEYLMRKHQEMPDSYFAYTAAPVMRGMDNSKSVEKTIDLLINNNAAFIRLFPKKMNFRLSGSETEQLLYILEDRRLPLMIWHTETTWGEIDQICTRYPMLPVIIDGNNQKLLYHNRVYIPLLLKHLNLYMETFNLIQYMAYETLVNKYKIDRFIFGTNYPSNSPLAPLYMLLRADIPEEVKEKILNLNIKKLMIRIKHSLIMRTELNPQ